ncbi:Zinc-type alcohol dehydrogenase-like protein YogA, partial [Trichoglossum hirsutum]
MGSRSEFRAMVEYVRVKKIRPVVSRVVHGLDLKEIDGLFEEMKAGKQFGKLVVELTGEGEEEGSKL